MLGHYESLFGSLHTGNATVVLVLDSVVLICVAGIQICRLVIVIVDAFCIDCPDL